MRKLGLLWLVCASAQAEVYQCKNAAGQAVFQKNPCRGQADAQPMDLKQPSAALLQKMRIEERQRDIQYMQLKLRERELQLQQQQAANEAARIDAHNRAIDASIAAQEAADRRSNEWNEYLNCRDRYGYGNNRDVPFRPRCVRPVD